MFDDLARRSIGTRRAADELVFANHKQEAIMATTFEKVSDGISHRLQDAGERIVDFKEDAAHDLGKRVNALGAMMKKHPLLSIGIGLTAGYVLARIIHRR